MEFVAGLSDGKLIAELERLQPANPFATAAYFESRSRLGYTTWVFGLRHTDGDLVCGCGAFLSRGALSRRLQIASLPSLTDESVFWRGVSDFCRRHGITNLDLGTFASPHGTNPHVLGHLSARRTRCEFVVDLSSDLAGIMSGNHRQSVRKAQRAGLTMRRTRSAEAAIAHQKLMKESMDRRRSNGENVPVRAASPEAAALLESGAGELFQAVREADVLSSALVLRASEGGYYQSAGTSSEGMAVCASHFLIHSISVQLKAEGARVFNLGGADEGSALANFKKWFGASRVPSLAANCHVGPRWRYYVGQAVHLFRSDRQKFWRRILGDWSRMLVYSTDTALVRTPPPSDGLVFRALSKQDLGELSNVNPSFRSRQLERVTRFGDSYAYGVFVGDKLAHISWLLVPEAMEKDPPRVVPADTQQAEITACETVPEFRGRGIYRFAIHRLLELARETGFRRVFMKTTPANLASQAAIEKAGLKRIGSAIVVALPLSRRRLIWRRFR